MSCLPFHVRLLLALGLVLLAAGEAEAQRVHLFASEDSVAVGERFEVGIVAEHNFMMEAELPTFDVDDEPEVQLGDVELLGIAHRGEGYHGTKRPGTHADTIRFEATTFSLDRAHVPAVTVPFVAGGDTMRVTSPPLTIPVVSTLPPEASDVEELAPLASFPRARWPWLLAVIGGLLLLSALLWAYRRREPEPQPEPVPPPPPKPTISPYERAIRQLRRLRRELPEDPSTSVKPLYVGLTDVLRTYLIERLGIPARELTSEELLQTIRHHAERGPLKRDITEQLAILVALIDRVKFAGERPEPQTGSWAIEEAERVLEAIEDCFHPSKTNQQPHQP